MIELHGYEQSPFVLWNKRSATFYKNNCFSSSAVVSRTTARGAAPIGYLGHGAHGGLQNPDVVFSHFVTWYVENRQILASGWRHTMVDGVLQTIKMLLKFCIIWKCNCCKKMLMYIITWNYPPPPTKHLVFLDYN